MVAFFRVTTFFVAVAFLVAAFFRTTGFFVTVFFAAVFLRVTFFFAAGLALSLADRTVPFNESKCSPMAFSRLSPAC